MPLGQLLRGWSPFALLHPTWRRLLDAAVRIPNPDGVALRSGDASLGPVLEGAYAEFRRLVERANASGAGPDGYDPGALDAVASALAPLLDAACHGGSAGDPRHDAVLAGGLLGLMVGSGGSRSLGRYVRRYGALSRIVDAGLVDSGRGMALSRVRFNRSVVEGALPPAPVGSHGVPAPGASSVDGRIVRDYVHGVAFEALPSVNRR